VTVPPITGVLIRAQWFVKVFQTIPSPEAEQFQQAEASDIAVTSDRHGRLSESGGASLTSRYLKCNHLIFERYVFSGGPD